MYNIIEKKLLSLADWEKAKILQWFFKTWKWEYGQWDIFLGIKVPDQRKIVKKYFKEVKFDDIQELLKSKYHEFRMTALLLLVEKYKKNWIDERKNIYQFYMKNLEYVNNWDLVDVTCPKIVWDFLFDKDRGILYDLVKSKNLWEQRISIISTLYFIRKWDFQDTLKLSEIFLDHKHDLIHKAVGWMLREVWKKDIKVLKEFLDKYAQKMPRTMLRYAIEKFEEKDRKHYLSL